MNNSRDPLRGDEPAEPSNFSVLAVVLVPLGLVCIFAGLCVGLWFLSVVYQLLYHPDQVPLAGEVLKLVKQDEAVFELVQENGTTRVEGAGVKYALLLAVLCVALLAIGSAIKAFLTGGKAILEAGLGRKRDDAPKPMK
jgi:Flp pilus assembly pilin Flp